MRKKLVSLLVGVALSGSLLAGCSSGDQMQSQSVGGTQETEVKVQDQTDAEKEAGGESITIGMFTSLTGASAIEGEMVKNGAELAAKLINQDGGVNGRPIEFIIYDDQSTPEGSVTAVTRMIESDHVDAIMGSNLSNNIIAVADQVEKAKIPFVGNGTGYAWTNCGYQYIYRATVNNIYINETFVRVMAEEMGVKNAAFLYVQTENGQTAAKAIHEYFEKYGVTAGYEGTYQSADTDFTGQVTNIIKADPEGVVLFGLANELALIVKQLRQGGYDGYIYMAEAGASIDLINVAGDAANGIVFSAAYVVPEKPDDAPTENMKAMLEEYVAEYGVMPITDVAYRSFDGLNLMAEAFRTASDMEDLESVRDAFQNIKGYDGLGGTFDFTKGTGDGLEACSMYMILDGTYHLFDKEKLLTELPVE